MSALALLIQTTELTINRLVSPTLLKYFNNYLTTKSVLNLSKQRRYIISDIVLTLN